MSTSWETVSVFISSTFNDMHAERDYLVKRVFPELREWCEQWKLRLVDIDLRWGITEADAMNKNVINVCLNQIDKCRPFFLCFIGQRRGWVPEITDIAPDTCTTFPDLKHYLGSASVTEIEILHAVIDPMNRKERADRAFFYLRDPSYLKDLPENPEFIRNTFTNEGIPDPAARKRADDGLLLWREEKIPKTGRPVHHYSATWNPEERTPELVIPLQCPSHEKKNQERWRNLWRELGVTPTSLDLIDDESLAREARKKNEEITRGRLGSFRYEGTDLAAMILDDLKEAISGQFPDHMVRQEETPLQKELDQQEQFLELNCTGFIRRSGDFDALDIYVAGDSRDLFVLTAPGGMGKTMLLANWIRQYQQRHGSDQPVFYRFIGGSDGSTTVDAVLRSLLSEMKGSGLLPEEIPIDPNELRNKLQILLASIGSRARVLVVIDGLNQLESGLKDLHWLPRRLPAGIRIIVSFKEEAGEAEKLASQFRESLPETFYRIPSFESRADRKKLVKVYLDNYLKQLDDTLIETLIDSPGATNPLFLKMALSELRIYGSFPNLKEKIRQDFGTTPVEAFGAVLKRLEDDPAFTTLPPKTTVPLLFGFLSHAKVGLSEDELVSLFLQELSSNREAVRDTIRLFLRQVRPFLALREGRYDFFYESFRLAAIERYEGIEKELHQRISIEWHQALVNYFEHLPAWISEKENIPLIRRAGELPYHLAWAGKADYLADLFLGYGLLETVVFGLGPYVAFDDISYVLSPPVLPMNKSIPTKNDALNLIQGALRLSAHVLVQNPKQLPSQLVGRLMGSKDPTIGVFVDKLNRFNRYPWLRPVTQSLIPPGGPLMWTLSGHHREVRSIVMMPDGNRVVSASCDGTLRFWDLKKGRELHTLSYSYNWSGIRAFSVTRDGKRGVSGSSNHLMVWDLENRKILHPITGLVAITRLTITPDSSKVVSASRDSTLKIWDLETGKELHTLIGHSRGGVWGVAVTPDNDKVVSASRDSTLKIWDLETGTELHTLIGHNGRICSLVITRDGKKVISGSSDTTLKVWDLENGMELRTLTGHTGEVRAIAVTCDCKQIVSGADDGTLKIWDLENGKELHTLIGHKGLVSAVIVTMDGKKVISASSDRTIKIWALQTGRELLTLSGHTDTINTISITPDDRWLVSGSSDTTLKVWDLENSQFSPFSFNETLEITAVALSNDGYRAVSGSFNGSLMIWDLKTGNKIQISTAHTTKIIAIAIAPDDNKVVSGARDGTLKIWDLETGKELHTLIGHKDSVRAVTVTMDCKKVISASSDRTIKIWGLQTGKELCTLTGHDGPIRQVAVTPDGYYAVSVAYDDTLKIWNLQTGTVLHTILDHGIGIKGVDYLVNAMTITPDGNKVVSTSFKKTINIWDLQTGRKLQTLKGHNFPINRVIVTPDGCKVISSSIDAIMVWDLNTGRNLQILSDYNYTMNLSLDGTLIVSAKNNVLSIWNLKFGEKIAEFYGDWDISYCGISNYLNTIIVVDNIGRIYILRLVLNGPDQNI